MTRRGEVQQPDDDRESSSPGLARSCAAQAIRVRSITRLRLGAPPAPNCRERCSRLTRSRRARSVVRTGRSTSPSRRLHAEALERLGEPEHAGAHRPAPGAARAVTDARDHHVAHHRIVHPLDGDRHGVLAAGEEQLAVVRPERARRPRRAHRAAGCAARRGPASSARVGASTTASTSRFSRTRRRPRGAPAGDQAGAAPRQRAPKRGQGGPALQQRGDRGHASLHWPRRPSRADRDEGADHLTRPA